MKYCINMDDLENQGITKAELLVLMAMYFNANPSEETFKSLHEKGYLYLKTIDEKGNYIYQGTRDGNEKLEQIFLNSEFKTEAKVVDRWDVLADKLRSLYPEGKKPGTHYMWRDSTAIISKKLRSIYKKYKIEFTDEEAIDATKRYIESFNGDYQYMQLLKYFLSKQVVIDGSVEENSQFLSYLSNKDNVNTNSQDWQTELR